MAAEHTADAPEASRRYLVASLAEVRHALERHVAALEKREFDDTILEEDREALAEAEAALSGETPLHLLCRMFDLSAFERDVVLLCAGMELDSAFSDLFAQLRPDRQIVGPTFSLALAALPDPHWSALSPGGPLRYWRLIEVGKGAAVTLSPLRIDERILHFLTGIADPDERLAGLMQEFREGEELAASQLECARQIAAIWEGTKEQSPPVFQLVGGQAGAKREIGRAVCGLFGLELWVLPARNLPAQAQEIDSLRRIWERECVLAPRALLLDCDGLDEGNPADERAIDQFLEGLGGPLFLSTLRRRTRGAGSILTFDVEPPRLDEQRVLWQSLLGDRAPELAPVADRLVYQFDLSASSIRSAHAAAVAGGASPVELLGERLWESCRVQARPRLDSMVQRIDPRTLWNDLVLPDRQAQQLRDLASQVRERATVYGTWGFGKAERGLGITALFAGPSGTGKTLAAEVIAGELRLDLYRIDLSTVVNKYIGETEKNLRRVFETAEAGGAILLFDEADALFGKRGDVRDSHDRYANIEVSYLLQRMEAYRGLAILTTNLKDNLDPAFVRRLRFIVPFPFPDAAQRALIWERVFPAATPSEGLDFEKLARLNVTGAEIRNIALHAAFLAAREGGVVTMGRLRTAALTEYAKLERTLTEAEVRGWA